MGKENSLYSYHRGHSDTSMSTKLCARPGVTVVLKHHVYIGLVPTVASIAGRKRKKGGKVEGRKFFLLHIWKQSLHPKNWAVGQENPISKNKQLKT